MVDLQYTSVPKLTIIFSNQFLKKLRLDVQNSLLSSLLTFLMINGKKLITLNLVK